MVLEEPKDNGPDARRCDGVDLLEVVSRKRFYALGRQEPDETAARVRRGMGWDGMGRD